MLNTNVMDQLSMIQSVVATVCAPTYDAQLTTTTCAGGPTNCQNQF